MHAQAILDGRFTSNADRFRARPGCCRVEPLEGRTLFAFTTVDAVPDSGNNLGMAADGLGNVYVAGYSNLSAPGGWDDTIRQGSNGGTTWENILTLPKVWNGSAWNEIRGIAASPTGDVYVGYGSQILERPAGDTVFHQVDSGSARLSGKDFMSVDATGKAYAIGSVPVTVTSGGKTTTQYRPAVLRQVDTLGAFSTVDTFTGGYLSDVCATTQGVYAVGVRQVVSGKTTTSHWLVRKSLTGNPGTWSTVDDFQYDAANNQSSSASRVTVDASGKVFVGGSGTKQVRTGGTDRRPIYTTTGSSLVRTSADGGASWTTDQVPSTGGVGISAIGTDAAGNVYVAGAQQGSGGTLLQMKPAAGGSWVTVDEMDNVDYAEAFGMTTDSNGNLYFAGEADSAGNSYGFVRMMPAAAPVTAGTFSSTSISDSTTARDSLLDPSPDALELLLA